MTILGNTYSRHLHLMTEETILRDKLALDRTQLANERTFLAYARTALALVVLAAFIFRFSPTPSGVALGLLALVAAGGVIVWGVRKYRTVSVRISGLYRGSEE